MCVCVCVSQLWRIASLIPRPDICPRALALVLFIAVYSVTGPAIALFSDMSSCARACMRCSAPLYVYLRSLLCVMWSTCEDFFFLRVSARAT